MTVGALNLGGYEAFLPTQVFIDFMKASDPTWNLQEYPAHPYANAAGWLIGLPNGVATQLRVIRSGTTAAGGTITVNRLGDYFMRWSGPATVVMNADSGLTVSGGGYGLVAPGRFKFSINNQSFFCQIGVTNTSGGSANLTDLSIVHSANEVLLDAGEIFDPAWAASLVGAQCVRSVLWGLINTFGFAPSTTTTVFSDIHAESDSCWVGTYAANPQAVPPSVLGKLGITIGKDLWICTPFKATDACLTSYYQAIYNTGFTGNIYAEAGNEPWNGGLSAYYWLRDTKAATITVVDANSNPSSSDVDKVACASADCAAAAWAAAESVFGTARVRRVYNTQAASTGFGAFYQYTDPRTGQKIKDLLNNSRGRVAIAPYFDLSATSALPDVSKRGLCDAKAYNQPDTDFRASMQAYITTLNVPWVAAHTNYMQARSPNCILTTYECGQSLQENNPEPTSQIAVTVDEVLNQVTIAAGSFAASYDNAEQTYLSFTIYSVQGLSTRTPYVKKNGTTGLQLFTDAALTNRITLIAQAGTFYIDNWTRTAILLDTKFKNFFDAPIGRTVYETDYFPIFTGKLEFFNHFDSSGDYTIGANGAQWGLKRSPLEADTPRATWFRGLAPVSSGLQETVSPGDVGGSAYARFSRAKAKRQRALQTEDAELIALLKEIAPHLLQHSRRTP